MAKKKEKLTSYTIKLSKADKEAIDELIDGCQYHTRAQVLRALPGLYKKAQDELRERREILVELSDRLDDWNPVLDGFRALMELVKEPI